MNVVPWAMNRWCNSIPYLTGMALDGSMRHGTDGCPIEPVSDEHRSYAKEKLLQIRQTIELRILEKRRKASAQKKGDGK